MTPLKRLTRLLHTQKNQVINIYIYSLFNGLLNLSIPLGISAIINFIQSGSPSSSWMVLVGLVLGGLALAGVFQIFQLSEAENIQQQIFTNASFEFAYRLPRLKISSLKNYYPPELVNRFFDIMTVQKGLSKILFDFSMAAVQIIFGLILLAFYHPFFIAYGIILMFLITGFFWLTSPRGLETSIRESRQKYKLVGWLEEVARNLSTFKMAGDTDLPMTRTDHLNTSYLEARKSHFSILKLQFGSLIVLKVLIAGGLLILGGNLVFSQQMNLGQFVAAEIIILLITSSVEKLILSMESIYDVLTGLEKIGGVTDMELEENKGTEKIPKGKHSLSIKGEGITVRSPQRDITILENISFEIKKGEKVGITGEMGSGKTALLQLIAGYFDDFSGRLKFDGIPFKHLELENFRGSVGDNLTPEELFEGTLFENISLHRETVTEEDVKKVIDFCSLTEFMNDLERGIHTPLPSLGLGLAQSIRIRILLARCLVGNHGLLLIEGSFHKLNSETKTRIIDFLLSPESPTLLLITNEAEILGRMDRIITLEKGKIVKNSEQIKKDSGNA